MKHEHEYTDFETISEEPSENLERVRKTDRPTLEDFSKVFETLGFVQEYSESGDDTEPNSFCMSMDKVVGRTIVNGVESLRTEKLRLVFRYDSEDFGDIDGDICNGLKVSIEIRKRPTFEETVYARPEDLELWTKLYLRTLANPGEVI